MIAVEEAKHSYGHVRHVREPGKKSVRELEEFFVNQHELESERYRVIDIKGPAEAPAASRMA